MLEIYPEHKLLLMKKAVEKYGDNISLCGNAKTWDECFTVENGEVLFWFNVGKFTYAEKISYRTEVIA